MKRGTWIRLVVSLALATSAQAQNAGEKRLQLSIRFDDAKEASQRVQALDGMPAVILLSNPQPIRERQYIPTPAGVIPQEITVVQGGTAAIEVTPHLAGDGIEVEISRIKVKGRLGEWFELGQVAMSAGGETRRLWVKVEVQDQGR
jgi:hypothetical protein